MEKSLPPPIEKGTPSPQTPSHILWPLFLRLCSSSPIPNPNPGSAHVVLVRVSVKIPRVLLQVCTVYRMIYPHAQFSFYCGACGTATLNAFDHRKCDNIHTTDTIGPDVLLDVTQNMCSYQFHNLLFQLVCMHMHRLTFESVSCRNLQAL